MTNFSVRHKAFLQALLSKQSLSFREAQPIIAAILNVEGADQVAPEEITPEILDALISTIHEHITPFAFDVVEGMDQRSGEKFYCVVNTLSDEYIQLATTHNADEIAFFRRLLDAMFIAYNEPGREVMAVPQAEAYMLGRPARGEEEEQGSGLTGKEVERVLDEFVEEGWLVLSPNLYYTLSVRALLELGKLLKTSYNVEPDDDDDDDTEPITRIHDCNVCNEILTVGTKCPNCNVRLHPACARRSMRGAKVCPGCHSNWEGCTKIGEKADMEAHEGQTTVRPRVSQGRRRQTQQTQTQTQTQTQRRRGRVVSDPEDEEEEEDE